MQAIQTRILPPTDTKPARVKAWASAGTLTMSVHSIPAAYDVTMHEYAARIYAEKMQWNNRIESGTLPNGDYCHVLIRD